MMSVSVAGRALVAFALFAALSSLAFAQQSPGGTLKRIADARVIALGHRTDSAPFSFVGADKQPAGYSVDICKRVAASLQQQLKLPEIRIKWVPVTAESRMSAVTKGDIDLECGTTTATLGRQETVGFSNLIFVDGGGILLRTDHSAQRLADLAGKRIAVTAGTTAEKRLPEVLKTRMISAQVVVMKGELEPLAAVEGGKVDAYANDRVVLFGLALKGKDPSKLALLNADFSFEPYALMLQRNDPSFRLAVNRALAQIYTSGAIGEIFDRWFGKYGAPSDLLLAMYYLNALPE
ncbi:MAG: amino acid ABC transporter substrate-binding protein [Betaproteobacteria bacterium]|nr:MAG: amino acid ABC transporter substrate-binding protein [Betaproteobacteria bacterium]